jgi:hypothetical protein
MSQYLVSPVTSNTVWLVPRSASHSLALSALTAWYPDKLTDYQKSDRHPATFLPDSDYRPANTCGLIVRNPIQRFRSMLAHKPNITIQQQLDTPVYLPLPEGPFARYFRFEDQLNEAAEWLGLPTPLPQEDATDEADKPTLTPEQEARVREIYADDIALWESLQPKNS